MQNIHITKQPAESYVIGLDFAPVLEDKAISAVSVSAVELESGIANSTVFEDAGFGETIVSVRVKNGNPDKLYKITVRVSTIPPVDVYEQDVFMSVMEE